MRHIWDIFPQRAWTVTHASDTRWHLAGGGGWWAIAPLPGGPYTWPIVPAASLLWGLRDWRELLGSGKQLRILWVRCQHWEAYSGSDDDKETAI